jgi:hypothetical protein
MVNYRYTNANIMHLKINTFKQIVIMLIFIAFTLIFFSQISIAATDYKWADKNHDSIIGPNNSKYNSLGYACLIIFKTDGTLDGNKGAYPESSDKDINTTYSNEAFSGVSKVPTCKDGKPASYVWIATNKKTAVVVKGNQDNKLVGVGAPYKGEASLWTIDSNGSASFKNNIANIQKPNNNVAPETEQTKQGSEEAQSEAQSGTQSQEANCSQALSPFGWVLCPATNFADNLYSFFKTLVNNLLFFESDKYENNGLYDSWKVMVTLANTVLVLVAIVMIAAQIFNFEFISAYTVKKALPRIVIAAILIQLSWFMVTTGIQIVNAIGSGLYWLLVAPFASKLDFGNTDGILEMGPILAQNYSGTDKGNTVGNAVVFYYAIVGLGAAAVGAALSGLWISIIIAAIGVVISLLVAIVTLVIREVLLIVLIAIAPLAIAFWILPGTNGLWNMWWKTFSKLLLMYPLIMLLFAGGTIAAILLASTGSGINILFAIIAFFAPMFMIGATYKFAGGAFASIANMTGKLGSSAKSSADKGFNPLRERIKANKEVRKEAKKNEALRGLYNGDNSYLNRWRAGTLGVPLKQGTREAYDRRNRKAQIQGLLAMNEDENLDHKLIEAEADNARAIWANSGNLVGPNSRAFLVDRATTGTRSEMRAAQQEIIKRGDVAAWQDVQTYGEALNNAVANGTASQEQTEKAQEYNRQRGSGEFAGAFMQKRADWIKGSAAYDTWGPEGFAMADRSAYAEMSSYLDSIRGTAEYNTVVNRLGSQLEETLNNDTARAQALKNPAGLMAARNELARHFSAAGSTSGQTAINQINPRTGTII